MRRCVWAKSPRYPSHFTASPSPCPLPIFARWPLGLGSEPLALGTMTFGTAHWGSADKVSPAIFNAYVAAGGNFVDTADVYAGGRSEELLGNYLAGRQLRDKLVLATKFGFSAEAGNPNASGNGRKQIYRALEGSLRRLICPPGTPPRRRRWPPRTACPVLLPCSWPTRWSSAMSSPLAAGFLAGKYERTEGGGSGEGHLSGPNPFGNTLFTDRNWRILDALRPVAAQLDRSLAQVALAWVLA